MWDSKCGQKEMNGWCALLCSTVLGMAVIFILVFQFGFVLLLGLFYFFVVTFSVVSFSSLKAKLDLNCGKSW